MFKFFAQMNKLRKLRSQQIFKNPNIFISHYLCALILIEQPLRRSGLPHRSKPQFGQLSSVTHRTVHSKPRKALATVRLRKQTYMRTEHLTY